MQYGHSCKHRYNLWHFLNIFIDITSTTLASGFVASICISGAKDFLYEVGSHFLDSSIVENLGQVLKFLENQCVPEVSNWRIYFQFGSCNLRFLW